MIRFVKHHNVLRYRDTGTSIHVYVNVLLWSVYTSVSGIRSQSKPHDIMHEVYRAMKTLGYVSCSLIINVFRCSEQLALGGVESCTGRI